METSTPDMPGERRRFTSFSQNLFAFGVLLIVVGALIFIGELISDSRTYPSRPFEPIECVADASIMLCGVVMAVCGQGLAALRSIAMNCAEKSD